MSWNPSITLDKEDLKCLSCGEVHSTMLGVCVQNFGNIGILSHSKASSIKDF